MADLKGKVGIVTGGGTGIGRATALAMAKVGAACGHRQPGRRQGRGGRATDPAGRWPGRVSEDRREQARRREGTGRAGGQGVRSAGPRLQQRRGGRPAGSAARTGHREGFLPVRREHQGRVLLHEVRDRTDAQDGRRGHREHVLDLRAERLPRLVAVRRHQARRHRNDQGGGAGLRQEEHPGECGRPRPGRDAAAWRRVRAATRTATPPSCRWDESASRTRSPTPWCGCCPTRPGMSPATRCPSMVVSVRSNG